MHRNIPEDYVAMEQKLCEGCCNKFESGAILLHQRLRSIPKDKTVTGWGVCPTCQKKIDEGYIVMVEAEARPGASRMQPDQASRTGRMVYVRKELAAHVFNTEITTSMVFIEPGVIEKLQEMYQHDVGESVPHV